MNPLITDLLRHQRWADGEHWRAISAHAPARDDQSTRARLHHLHQVQRFFAWICLGGSSQPAITKLADFADFDALRGLAVEAHADIVRCLTAISDARLEESIAVPWFRDPPLTLSVAEALTQMAMHSQHHRGQNAARLRDLGAVPPTTDLIVWYWKGRPKADERLGA